MNLFCLLSGSGETSTDGPDRLVGDDDLTEILFRKVEDAAFELGLYHLVLLACLTLFLALTDAEDYLQIVFLSQDYLLFQDLRCLLVIFTTFGVSEDDILCTCRLHHFSAYLTSEGAFLLVGTVLSSQTDNVLIEELSDACQVDKRCTDDNATVGLVSFQCLIEFFCKSNAVLKIHVHLPVAGYNFLSHNFYFFFI